EIDWNNIEDILDTESIITKSIDKESNYQIENSFNINDILTSYVVLDMIDGLIQCCSKKALNQHPLTKLIEGEHFFERQGSGKKPFSCENKHKNDTTKALELLGQWILNVAASEEIKPKEELLIKLSPVLTLFNQSISKQSIS
ncbi:2662_t:CDS:2, partial [Funneliformis mosseae]